MYRMRPSRVASQRLVLAAALWTCSAHGQAAAGIATSSAQQHLQQAHAFLAQKQPAKAIPEFQAVLQVDPNNADAVGNLGVLLYFVGDYAHAEPLLERTVATQPVPKLKGLLGLAQRRSGQPEAARATLTQAFPALLQGQDAFVREVGLELVELDSAAGDLPAAAAVIAQLKARLPADAGVLYAAYRVNTDLANEAMLQLSLVAPSSAEMHRAMAHELSRERDLKGAITNYRAAMAADPKMTGLHFELAEVLRQSPEPELKAEAEQQYQLAVKADPSNAQALTRLGDYAADRSEHDSAITYYRSALKLAPQDSNANVGLAHELVETNHPDEALALLLNAEKADPTDTLVHFRLAALYRRLKRPDDAHREVADYERYKAMKDKLHAVYKEMRVNAPGRGSEDQTQGAKP